ncbi:MAG: hypothetical protein KDA60_16760, partial [Planctomycetales bacterium]|nr:hypothetical protein [Planctomycetales bacterium]
QEQLDRQFQARQNAGQSVATTDLNSDPTPLITLRPLYVLLALAICASTVVYWVRRIRQVRGTPRTSPEDEQRARNISPDRIGNR